MKNIKYAALLGFATALTPMAVEAQTSDPCRSQGNLYTREVCQARNSRVNAVNEFLKFSNGLQEKSKMARSPEERRDIRTSIGMMTGFHSELFRLTMKQKSLESMLFADPAVNVWATMSESVASKPTWKQETSHVLDDIPNVTYGYEAVYNQLYEEANGLRERQVFEVELPKQQKPEAPSGLLHESARGTDIDTNIDTPAEKMAPQNLLHPDSRGTGIDPDSDMLDPRKETLNDKLRVARENARWAVRDNAQLRDGTDFSVEPALFSMRSKFISDSKLFEKELDKLESRSATMGLSRKRQKKLIARYLELTENVHQLSTSLKFAGRKEGDTQNIQMTGDAPLFNEFEQVVAGKIMDQQNVKRGIKRLREMGRVNEAKAIEDRFVEITERDDSDVRKSGSDINTHKRFREEYADLTSRIDDAIVGQNDRGDVPIVRASTNVRTRYSREEIEKIQALVEQEIRKAAKTVKAAATSASTEAIVSYEEIRNQQQRIAAVQSALSGLSYHFNGESRASVSFSGGFHNSDYAFGGGMAIKPTNAVVLTASVASTTDFETIGGNVGISLSF